MLHTPEHKERPRNARLEARVPSAQKALFQRAAALSGRTLSELVIDSTQEMAARIVHEHEVIRLSRQEQIAFVSALLTPPEPGPRLQKAAQTYRRKAGL
ncbi:MAG: DUF1778 domain-containing protein [Desulfovibrionaceae bacterium]|nr:DUF1778 domain-containing protein [Desulfovibrionaceae bacterium]